MSVYIGIDPGKSGGIAVIKTFNDERLPDVWADKMPETEGDIWDYFDSLLLEGICYLEQITPRPAIIKGKSIQAARGSIASFKLGEHYGYLKATLKGHNIPTEIVPPAKWQKALGCLTKGDKNITKAKAQQLFPSIKVTHAVADALLIAEYGRRLNGR